MILGTTLFPSCSQIPRQLIPFKDQISRKNLKLSKKSSGSKPAASSNSEEEPCQKSKRNSSKKSKKKKKAKQSFKHSSIDYEEERESGEISSDTSAGSDSEGSLDANQELAAALSQKEKAQGIWGQVFTGLHSHDLQILAETDEIFSTIDKPLYEVLIHGGSVIINLNKSIKSLSKKWAILKSAFEKKKKTIEKKERGNIENMIKATISFLDDWLETFSANSYAKASISSVIARYEERVLKSLLGASTAREIVIKLKGLLKSHHQLQNVSWAKLGNWSAAQRGFSKGPNNKNNGRGRGNRHGRIHYGGSYSNFNGGGGYGYGGYGGGYGGGYNSGYGGSYYGGGYGDSDSTGGGQNRSQTKQAKNERQSGSRM